MFTFFHAWRCLWRYDNFIYPIGDVMIDLSFVPTEELVLELSKRFDSAIFCGHKRLADKGPMAPLKERYRRWFGDRTICGGLGLEVSLCAAGEQLHMEMPGAE